MPTRLLREGILSSEAVDSLDAPAEVFYRRLMSKVDDHGLFDARMSILRASLFPLRTDRVREADISRWMAACQKAGLIVLYEADGKPYLSLLKTGWDKRSKPKYPLPPENTCKQPSANPNTSTVVVVESVVGVVKKPLSGKPDDLPGFNRVWKAWPAGQRKVAKSKCMALWKRKGLELQADDVVAHVVALAASESWRTGFDPMPLTYLNQERWDGADPSAPAAGEKPWFINGWHSIVEKGKAHGLHEVNFPSAPDFRLAVLKAEGITAEQIKQAEAQCN